MEKFFEAIRKNDIETVESMIQSGQDVNVKDVFGSSPLHVAVRRSFSQGDKVKIETEDFGTIYGEFHRYGASRFGAIIFVNGVMRFVDEQSLNYA